MVPKILTTYNLQTFLRAKSGLNIGQIKVKDDAITSCTLRSGSLQSNTQTKASFHPTEKPL
jgi:hypothetical protein